MCLYYKDDGEQCSRDEQPFCFQHDDTQQAKIYHTAQNATDSSQSNSTSLKEAEYCGDCETPVRVVVGDVSETGSTTMNVVSIVATCECRTAALDSYTLADSNTPAGWE
jgi:hypothetical protein